MEVVVVIGPGQIGQSIARRIGVGKHSILADVRRENAHAAADVLSNAGFDVSLATVDASMREAVQALAATAAAQGDVVARGGSGVVIASIDCAPQLVTRCYE